MSIRPMGLSPSAAAGAYVAAATKAGDLSAGDVTLSTVDTRSRIVELTGATATQVVTFPTGSSYSVRVTNSTNYAQTLKRSGGTGSVSLASGDSAEVMV